MRRAAVVAFAATVITGVVALGLVATQDQRALAFTLGVVPGQVAVELKSGETVCQGPINASSDFTRVRTQIGTYRRSGEPLEFTVGSRRSGRQLAEGRLPGGYADGAQPSVHVGAVSADQAIDVCIRNGGERKIALYGATTAAAPGTEARIRGAETGTDLTLVFERAKPRSMLSAVPDIFERASVFRPGWVGPWTFWVLAALLIAAVPTMLALAVARAARP